MLRTEEKVKRVTGTLYRWNTRGFGIIRSTPNALGIWKEYFVHVSCITSGEPIAGSFCEFTVGPPAVGRPLLPALDCKISPKVELSEFLIATLTAVKS